MLFTICIKYSKLISKLFMVFRNYCGQSFTYSVITHILADKVCVSIYNVTRYSFPYRKYENSELLDLSFLLCSLRL